MPSRFYTLISLPPFFFRGLGQTQRENAPLVVLEIEKEHRCERPILLKILSGATKDVLSNLSRQDGLATAGPPLSFCSLS